MSLESVRKFLERIKNDDEFKKALNGLDKEGQQKFIQDEGYEFTRDELLQVTGELEEDELDLVAGGSGSDCNLDVNVKHDDCGTQCVGACKNDCQQLACEKKTIGCEGQDCNWLAKLGEGGLCDLHVLDPF